VMRAKGASGRGGLIAAQGGVDEHQLAARVTEDAGPKTKRDARIKVRAPIGGQRHVPSDNAVVHRERAPVEDAAAHVVVDVGAAEGAAVPNGHARKGDGAGIHLEYPETGRLRGEV